jgi:uncharacterized membrane protein
MKKELIIKLIIALLFVFGFWPVSLIFALNLLIPTLAIPYTFSTWLGASLLIVIFNSRESLNKSKQQKS